MYPCSIRRLSAGSIASSFEYAPDTVGYGLLEGIPVLGMVGSLLMAMVADRLLKDYGSLIGLLSMAGMFLIAAQPTTVPLVIDGAHSAVSRGHERGA